MIALFGRGLAISGVVLADDWSYEGWLRTDGMPPTRGAAYERVRDQDPSQVALLEAAPGTVWVLERDSDETSRRSELYATFLDHARCGSTRWDHSARVAGSASSGRCWQRSAGPIVPAARPRTIW